MYRTAATAMARGRPTYAEETCMQVKTERVVAEIINALSVITIYSAAEPAAKE